MGHIGRTVDPRQDGSWQAPRPVTVPPLFSRVLWVLALTGVPALAAAPTLQWPFDQPDVAHLRASPRKVFAHYFSPFPVSIDNRPSQEDYYTRGYLSVEGEKGKHRAYGGYLRQRPLPRPPRPETNWAELDMMEEVRLAAALGLDGFCYDILSTEGRHWTRLNRLLAAAQAVDPGFRIMLMPDMMAEFRRHPDRLVPAVLKVAGHPAILRDERRRLVLAPYNAHVQSVEWWTARIGELRQNGVEVMFFPLFQGWWKQAEAFAPISDGFSDWGVGTASAVLGSRRLSPQKCHAYGKLWMAPIRPQDFRPKARVAWEAANSTLFRNMWQVAIEGKAEWAQIITWNDYSEASEIAPSTETGRVFYDLAAYYVAWFKAGRAPDLVRDAIYGIYRVQSTDIALRGQSKRMKVVGEASNQIELLAFLAAPGDLVIEIGTSTFRKSAPAGVTSFCVPLAPGTPVFQLLRNGTNVLRLTGRRAIVSGEVEFQNLLYHGVGSVASP